MCVLDSVHVEGRGTWWKDLAQLPESGEIQLCRPQSSGVITPFPPSATRTSHWPRLRHGELGLLRNWVQLQDTLGAPCGTQTIDQGVPALSIGQPWVKAVAYRKGTEDRGRPGGSCPLPSPPSPGLSHQSPQVALGPSNVLSLALTLSCCSFP